MKRIIQKGEEVIAAIIGGSKCGKTTLAIALAAMYWRVFRIRAIVFDPFAFEHHWGNSAWVTSDIDAFKRAVAGTKGCVVFWDESSSSLNKGAAEDKAFFTNIRHNHKGFYVLGHDPTVLSPLMRGNLSDAYIFRQSETRAKIWCEVFADTDLLETMTLEKREFIHKRAFEKTTRHKPGLEQLANWRP